MTVNRCEEKRVASMFRVSSRNLSRKSINRSRTRTSSSHSLTVRLSQHHLGPEPLLSRLTLTVPLIKVLAGRSVGAAEGRVVAVHSAALSPQRQNLAATSGRRRAILIAVAPRAAAAGCTARLGLAAPVGVVGVCDTDATIPATKSWTPRRRWCW